MTNDHAAVQRDALIKALVDSRRLGLGGKTEQEACEHMADAILAAEIFHTTAEVGGMAIKVCAQTLRQVTYTTEEDQTTRLKCANWMDSYVEAGYME